MIKPVPKKMLTSKYRREMWRRVKKVIAKVERSLPISEAYVMGSFTTKKRRPADIDFIIMLKTPHRDRKSKWSLDLVIAPDNAYGREVFEGTSYWVKRKYGARKSATLRLK